MTLRSQNGNGACWHLDPNCRGLEHVPYDQRLITLTTTAELAGDAANLDPPTGRPCRVCALEAVLRTVLRFETRDTKTATVSFTSLPAATIRQGHQGRRVRGNDGPTVSGQARIRRLARHLDLATTDVPGIGTIAFGDVNAAGAPTLTANLDTVVLGRRNARRRTPPTCQAESIGNLWALLDDETSTARNRTDRRVAALWSTARLLAAGDATIE